MMPAHRIRLLATQPAADRGWTASHPRPSSREPTVIEASAGDVTAFVDHLLELRLPGWLAIGRGLIADRDGRFVRLSAWGDVERALAEHGLAVDAWQVREGLATAAWFVNRSGARWTREERRAFAATLGAADAAAMALLARPYISVETVRTLCAPFG